MCEYVVCGLTRPTHIFSKLIIVKFLFSGSLREEKASLNQRCCEVVTHWGFMHATVILVSEKHHKRMLYYIISSTIYSVPADLNFLNNFLKREGDSVSSATAQCHEY